MVKGYIPAQFKAYKTQFSHLLNKDHDHTSLIKSIVSVNDNDCEVCKELVYNKCSINGSYSEMPPFLEGHTSTSVARKSKSELLPLTDE